MKKFLSALAAAVLLCCTLVSPASAAETYQKGDVNMDGVVDISDAQLILCETVDCMFGHECNFSETQIELATIVGRSTDCYFHPWDIRTIPFGVDDAQLVCVYSALEVAGIDPPAIEDWEAVFAVYSAYADSMEGKQ